MNEHQIADIWMMFKEYVDSKTLEDTAERYVDLLVDHGVSDKLLRNALGNDEVLDGAIEYYLDESDDEEWD